MRVAAPKSAGSAVHTTETISVVFVVDQDNSVRTSLEPLIRSQGWQVLTFESASQFLAFPRVAVPCCLLLDFALPDLNGLDLQQRVSDRCDMPVIFITYQTDVPTTVKAMKAGALECLIKPLQTAHLLTAIGSALDRSRAIQSQEAAVRILRERFASLSPREVEVMALVVSGWLNKEVGAALGISEVTVKVHRFNVMRKMKADSFADLVKFSTTLRLTAVPRDDRPSGRSFGTRSPTVRVPQAEPSIVAP